MKAPALKRYLPFTDWLFHYKRENLSGDILAGAELDLAHIRDILNGFLQREREEIRAIEARGEEDRISRWRDDFSVQQLRVLLRWAVGKPEREVLVKAALMAV